MLQTELLNIAQYTSILICQKTRQNRKILFSFCSDQTTYLFSNHRKHSFCATLVCESK